MGHTVAKPVLALLGKTVGCGRCSLRLTGAPRFSSGRRSGPPRGPPVESAHSTTENQKRLNRPEVNQASSSSGKRFCSLARGGASSVHRPDRGTCPACRRLIQPLSMAKRGLLDGHLRGLSHGHGQPPAGRGESSQADCPSDHSGSCRHCRVNSGQRHARGILQGAVANGDQDGNRR